MLVQGLGQQKTLREWPGLLHFLVYAGFIVLFIGTLMVAVHEDLGIHFLYGHFYLFYSLTLDILSPVHDRGRGADVPALCYPTARAR
jgi:hypothetical protein